MLSGISLSILKGDIMGTLKDVYDVLKDLMSEAKRLKNQEMISLAMDLQSMFFDFKEEIETVKEENKSLKEEIKLLNEAQIDEKNIEYTPNGFFTLKTDRIKMPYCSACWKLNKKLVPLSKGVKTWYHYSCPSCKSDLSILDTLGNPLF